MTRIVTAAIVERDGKVLVARRRAGLIAGGLWEFPGGKLDEGEDPRRGLERELREELGVGARAGAHVCTVPFSGPLMSFELVVFRTELLSDQLQMTDHDEVRWLAPEEMDETVFSKPDRPVVRLLAGRGGLGTEGDPESLSSPLLGLDVALINLAVLRHRDWECNSATAGDLTFTYHGVVSAGGEMYLNTPPDPVANGTSSGRIKSLAISSSGISQAWFGIHPAYAGYSGVISSEGLSLAWEAELSGNSATTGSYSGDGYDYLEMGSVAVRHDYYVSTYAASTAFDDHVGKYLILGRLKVDASTTTAVVTLYQYNNSVVFPRLPLSGPRDRHGFGMP